MSRYDDQAVALAAQYEALDAGSFNAYLGLLFPDRTDRLALDVGAGSGRDAAWLASLGFDVTAVEPSAAMRREGQRYHAGAAVRWLDDRLPDLAATHRLGLSFELILLSGVWQQVLPSERARAFRKLVTLLKPAGIIVLSLRNAPAADDPSMHPVSLGEIEALALDQGIAITRVEEKPDALGRAGIRWTLVTLRLPDDGAGALPLLRGIILNDDKASTYKLGLLRAVARAADLTPALAVPILGEDRFELPLGLIALNWVRLYLPLVSAVLPQLPGNRGPDRLGFAKAGFRSLLEQRVAAQDLRVGQTFTGERAVALANAIAEVARTIVTMPANFIRFSNSSDRVFGGVVSRARAAPQALTLEATYLRSLGTLSVPGNVWRAMQRLGAWIEPVLVSEWTRIIQLYAERMSLELAPGVVEAALAWQEPKWDTALARLIVDRMFAAREPVHCVWSGQVLRAGQIDIDHCLPWSAWPCGDLWNLLPSSRIINQRNKRERLPSATALAAAKPLVIDWWRRGWQTDVALTRRFDREVQGALPVGAAPSLDEVFTALECRRLRLRQDQQVSEWAGMQSAVTTAASPV